MSLVLSEMLRPDMTPIKPGHDSHQGVRPQNIVHFITTNVPSKPSRWCGLTAASLSR
jgi:hypothetical protein